MNFQRTFLSIALGSAMVLGSGAALAQKGETVKIASSSNTHQAGKNAINGHG